MQIPIHSVADLGLAIRAVRHASGVRLDDLAATASVSKQFTSDVEYGKSTVRLGLVLRLLEELGIQLQVDVPQAASAAFDELRRKGALQSRSRSSDAQP
ncbi:helix-turn-helix domain-containing protein [Xylophilus sp. GOD-11R]|uniref:helix-turn-helix domain-containing protein n=1 Tax=Xylophilus sp. GOD-11R TaxID=3089814 RepID=UPI00298C051A|nr:helix-turn-helix domain-containing protein [Xylophilus sp. GOD-11R]WPB59009.1 transcriptional regulator [Xylophilus sp. GOD-11R]